MLPYALDFSRVTFPSKIKFYHNVRYNRWNDTNEKQAQSMTQHFSSKALNNLNSMFFFIIDFRFQIAIMYEFEFCYGKKRYCQYETMSLKPWKMHPAPFSDTFPNTHGLILMSHFHDTNFVQRKFSRTLLCAKCTSFITLFFLSSMS